MRWTRLARFLWAALEGIVSAFPYEWNEDFISRAGGVAKLAAANRVGEAEGVAAVQLDVLSN